ncbi:YqgQ family protein [Pseudalkalibacillus caeni]|uniref:DUF910 family protein n=1 Tax=Exobacillus caeni TaxID=2574798 RepID=A0A5R9EYE4_9BACL|nr:YqgQ family protein [Pseudalkalibacillus caeni]TLS36322.1 DUF910 family protein [Pseudalkalibacillus caeni]
MKTIYEVQQLLKRFGTFIYTGDRIGDLELMEEELRELNGYGIIDQKEYTAALMVIRGELRKERQK